MAWKKPRNKFYNRKVRVRGHVFDSLKEGRRYQELLLLQQAGEIRDLKCQVSFILLPSQRYKDPASGRYKVERGVKYIADFTYTAADGELIVEDVKGLRTKDYVIKRKLLLWTHGIRILET